MAHYLPMRLGLDEKQLPGMTLNPRHGFYKHGSTIPAVTDSRAAYEGIKDKAALTSMAQEAGCCPTK